MNDGRTHKSYNDYGGHQYSEGHTGRCSCGCRMQRHSSSGPIGVDPFGNCPDNPKDKQRQAENHDYADLVNGRMAHLELRLKEASGAVKIVEQAEKSTNIDLVRQLEKSCQDIASLKMVLHQLESKLSEASSLIAKRIPE